MSYLRGEPYVWSDGSYMHIWSGMTDKGWEQKAKMWVEDFDALVLMRYAEMTEAEKDDMRAHALARAVGNHGVRALERRSA